MAYFSGGLITALDYNDLIAQVNEIFDDFPQGIRTDDTYGYGQKDPILTEVSEDAIIRAAEWNTLYVVVKRIGYHQGYFNESTQPPPLYLTDETEKGDIIAAYDSLVSIIEDLRERRLEVNELGDTMYESTRSTSWDGIITHTFILDFITEDRARYFFNTGSEVWFETWLDPDTSDPDDLQHAWQRSLSRTNPVKFNWQTTNAPAGDVKPIGFYSLNANDPLLTQIYVKRVDPNDPLEPEPTVLNNGNYYDSDNYSISARFVSAARNKILFEVQYESDVAQDRVGGNLRSTIKIKTTTEESFTVIEPIYQLQIGLDQGGN